MSVVKMFGAVAVAAAASMGGSAVIAPAVGCAAPQEWDIGSYDGCMRRTDDQWNRGLIKDIEGAHRLCCEGSGGVWNAGSKKCEAPPAAPAARVPGPIASNTLQPVAPPMPAVPRSDVTATLVPAPPG